MVQASTLPFVDHIHELRRRLAWSMAVVMVGATAGYLVRTPLIAAIQRPLGLPLFYTSPSGGFEFVMLISLSVGIILALPIIIYNLLRFVEPAIAHQAFRRQRFTLMVAASYGLAVLGVAFGYFLILPAAFHFFAEYNVGPIKPLITTSEYFSFVVACLTTFAVVFQLPLVLLFFDSVRPFPPSGLARYRKHVIIGSFVLALLLPFTYDPVTQCLMALPIILLYELAIILIWGRRRRRRKLIPEALTPLATSVSRETSRRPHSALPLDRPRPIQLG